MLFRLTGVLAVWCLLASGCTPLNVKRVLDSPPPDVPPRTLIDNIPFFPQTQYYCGPSTLAMVLSHYGFDATPEQLARAAYTPALKGSLQAEMASTLRRQGVMAYPLPNNLEALLQEIAKGHPVIVLQNLGLSISPRWHYAVALGYDLTTKEMILHSGKQRHYRLPLKTFAYTWARSKNWGLVPLPIGQLPAQNDPKGIFIAAAELALTGPDKIDTAQIYKNALARWPQQLPFSIALSNAHYEDGNYPQATQVLLAALQYDSASPLLYNNLAYSLLAQRCNKAALQSIECANRLDNAEQFQSSYHEITAEIDAGRSQTADLGAQCPVFSCPEY